VVALFQAFPERKYMDRFLLRVISWFPFIALGILGVQLIYSNIILTGTAMMIATLAVHLNFQVKKISEDNLTKLPNRDTFAKTVEMVDKRGKPITIVLISLDDFKVINDTFGQLNGDRFLVAITAGLKELFPEEKLYRYGGDEFALILGKNNTLSEAQLIQRLKDKFHEPWHARGLQARISASIAILTLPLVQEEHLDPINLLDHAMRTIKNKGKGNSVICDESILRTMKRRNRLIERLKRGITTGSFSLNYQPIFHLTNETMNTAEALLRLQDEILGEIGPSEFIPLAEEIGIINEIGMWVLEEVCKFLKQLSEMFLEQPAISINFSVQQLTDNLLVEKIIKTMNDYEIPGSLLRFEITESTFIGSSYQEILSVMEPLIAKGIHFHLDDFGTGYSNLAYVINLPFECIKLDKSLLWDIEQNERMQVFVERLVRAVSQMGAKVIIEGIETQGQQEFIKRIGCDMVQGYYFSPPLSEQDFTSTLAQNREFLLTKNGL
jgi:diguanylate cyclase